MIRVKTPEGIHMSFDVGTTTKQVADAWRAANPNEAEHLSPTVVELVEDGPGRELLESEVLATGKRYKLFGVAHGA